MNNNDFFVNSILENVLHYKEAHSVTELLISLYNINKRYYHSLDHAIDVVKNVKILAEDSSIRRENFAPMILAALFHDAVYSGDDEKDVTASALIAYHAVNGTALSNIALDVKRCVQVTLHHKPIGEDECIVSDADMAILGSDPSKYKTYKENVRAEYVSKGVTHEQFNQGRLLFLKTLDVNNIFRTDYGIKFWAPQAKINIANEISSLENQTHIAPP